MKVYSWKNKDGRVSWSVDYSFDGIRYRRRIGYGERGREAAEKKILQIKAEIETGSHQASRKTKGITFKDFVNSRYLDFIKKKKFYSRSGIFFLRHLINYFGNMPMHKITYSMIEKYHAERSGASPVAANRELSLLRAIFNKAEFWNQKSGYGEQKLRLPGSNPVKGIEFNNEQSRRRFASDDEIKRILLNADSDKLRDLVLLALNTGMRKGEIQKLSVKQHIDWNLNVIDLPETKSKHLKKSNEIQKVPMNLITRGILLKYKDREEEFPFDYNFRKVFDNAIAESNIVGLHFHDLRRTFAVFLRLKGTDIFTVSALLRHSPPESLRVTAIYTPAVSEELHKAVAKLDDHFLSLLETYFPAYHARNLPKPPKIGVKEVEEEWEVTPLLKVTYGA